MTTKGSNSIYKALGASNHTDKVREQHDYYATSPEAAEWLLKLESFDGEIWECASGENHLANVFKSAGYTVRCSDIIKRTDDTEVLDFLNYGGSWDGNIITNPPYKYAVEFVEKAMSILKEGKKLALFLKIQFLEGKRRKVMYAKYPPKRIWVSSSRLLCAKNADFDSMTRGGLRSLTHGFCGRKVLAALPR